MRCYEQSAWHSLPSEQRAKFLARQGHAFATAGEVRVVYQPGENGAELKDVPRDGKTLGEIVTKGNIVMKEVSEPLGSRHLIHLDLENSIFVILRLLRRLSVGVLSDLAIWRSGTLTGRLPS